jgi:signal peptidase
MSLTKVREVVTGAAIAWLAVICTLVTWSLIPMVAGWQPAVVMTGSMMPVIQPGDVVVVDPGVTPVRGQIVLMDDPEVHTGRVAHRIVSVDPDGTFTTKGDANQTVDSVRRSPQGVVGVVRLVIPAAGKLALARTSQDRGVRLWVAATVLASLVVVGGALLKEPTAHSTAPDTDPDTESDVDPDTDLNADANVDPNTELDADPDGAELDRVT